ncbi:MAG TPA: hypothetical protein VGH19_00120 [Verrucomicrobiae bacterium]
MQSETFLEIWKQTHKETSASFEEDVFWKTLYPHAQFFARIVWRVWRGFFSKDLEFIRRLGAVTSAQEAHLEVDNERYQRPEYGLLRRHFKLRVSGKRAIHLVKRAMREREAALQLDASATNPVNSQACFPSAS